MLAERLVEDVVDDRDGQLDDVGNFSFLLLGRFLLPLVDVRDLDWVEAVQGTRCNVNSLARRSPHRRSAKRITYLLLLLPIDGTFNLLTCLWLCRITLQKALRRGLVENLLALGAAERDLVRLLPIERAHFLESLRGAQIVEAGVVEVLGLLSGIRHGMLVSWVLKDCVLVLQSLVAFNIWSGPHANRDVQLKCEEHCDTEPKRNSD